MKMLCIIKSANLGTEEWNLISFKCNYCDLNLYCIAVKAELKGIMVNTVLKEGGFNHVIPKMMNEVFV